MNGLEETRILKKLMPAVPVIIYSAHLDSFMEKEAQRAGHLLSSANLMPLQF
jgi:DNA-binding NarL/FixJ family response regulator